MIIFLIQRYIKYPYKTKNPTIKVGFILDNSYYITTVGVSYHMQTKGPELYLLGNR